MELVDFLLARIAEDEKAARAAIDADRPGSHWHWVMDHTDTPIAHGHLQAAQDDGESVSLRTVEEYPTRSGVGPLPHFVVQLGEVHGAGGEHIARWDPARGLVECEAKRRIAERYQLAVTRLEHGQGDRAVEGIRANESRSALKILALPYADHPDYDETWSPHV